MVMRGKIEIMKLVQVKITRPVEVEKWSVKILNAENMIQNISLLDLQILLLMEERPHCLLCTKILTADSMKADKLMRHLVTTVHAECVGKTWSSPKEK
jgi:hypothetical protein